MPMTKHSILRMSLVLLTVLAGGCGAQFDLTLTDRFVVLEEDDDYRSVEYELHATSVDGVVVGVRRVEHDVEGTLTFWSEAVRRRLRDGEGYALLGEDEIQAASGEKGQLLRFGRELEGHQYRYTLALFVTGDHLWLVEAGGREEAFTAAEADIERALKSFRVGG